MKLQVSCLINPAPPAAGLTPETYTLGYGIWNKNWIKIPSVYMAIFTTPGVSSEKARASLKPTPDT